MGFDPHYHVKITHSTLTLACFAGALKLDNLAILHARRDTDVRFPITGNPPFSLALRARRLGQLAGTGTLGTNSHLRELAEKSFALHVYFASPAARVADFKAFALIVAQTLTIAAN